MSGFLTNFPGVLRLSVAGAVLLAVSGCADGQMPSFLKPKAGSGEEVVSRASSAEARAPRDVEAPEIFQAREAGLWDGRPSLGGVWVAHPEVQEPERVIIRNQQNGKFVIGALFRKERETPGPRLQVSSDAAAALGILAGQPTNLDVVALRREEAPEPEPAALGADAMAGDPLAAVPAAPAVAEAALDPVIGGAATAIETASLDPAPTEIRPEPLSKPPAAPAAAAAKLAKPFIQIGIFSVEQNANNTATAMRQAGMVPSVKAHNTQGKKFWRVVVGPAQSKDELAMLLKKIKETGFTDAYAVTD